MFKIVQITLCFLMAHGRITIDRNELSNEMMSYLRLTVKRIESRYYTVGVVSTHDSLELNYLVKIADDVAFIHENPLLGSIPSTEQPPKIMMFVHSVPVFKIIFKHMLKLSSILKQAYIEFVICEAVAHERWLKDILDFTWEYLVINFVLVFEKNSHMEIVGFNPFKKQIYRLSKHDSEMNFYPDKLLNVYGYKMTVGMSIDIPRNTYREGELIGVDVNRIKQMTQYLNATLKIILFKKLKDVHAAILDRSINFSFTRHFLYANNKFSIRPSYPIEMDYVVVTVPTSKPIERYKYIFAIFKGSLWGVLLLLVIFIIAVTVVFVKVTRERNFGVDLIVISVYQILLTTSNLYVDHVSFKVRWILGAWILFAILITTTFNSTLRSSIMAVKYKKDIEKLDELMDSEYQLATSASFGDKAIESFQKYSNKDVHLFSDEMELINDMFLYEKKYAYIFPKTYVENIIQRRDDLNREVYHVLTEKLVVGYSIYNFPKHSPFVDLFNHLILLDKQYGFSSFASFPDNNEVIVSSNDVALSIYHIEGALFLLGLGCIVSAIGLLLEIVYFNFQRISSRLQRSTRLFHAHFMEVYC